MSQSLKKNICKTSSGNPNPKSKQWQWVRGQQSWAKGGAVIFLRHELYRNYVSSVEAGMGMEGQIMCIEQCTKIVCVWGFVPDTAGELTALF